MKSQAITAYGKPLEEVTSDIPTPKGTEVVVKITYSGVCHSDVHLQDGHVDLGDGDKIDWSRGRTLPHTLGHEIEGTLSAVGPEAQGLLALIRQAIDGVDDDANSNLTQCTAREQQVDVVHQLDGVTGQRLPWTVVNNDVLLGRSRNVRQHKVGIADDG